MSGDPAYSDDDGDPVVRCVDCDQQDEAIDDDDSREGRCSDCDEEHRARIKKAAEHAKREGAADFEHDLRRDER